MGFALLTGLCLGTDCFSLQGEVWGWALFYAGTAWLAYGSAYYHLKPDDNRVMWDSLPVRIIFILPFNFGYLYASFAVIVTFKISI